MPTKNKTRILNSNELGHLINAFSEIKVKCPIQKSNIQKNKKKHSKTLTGAVVCNNDNTLNVLDDSKMIDDLKEFPNYLNSIIHEYDEDNNRFAGLIGRRLRP